MNITQADSAIKKIGSSQKPTLIAIEGYGGSGKSTFAQSLRGSLGSAYIICMDDFIVKEKLGEASWDSGVFDRLRLEEQVLKPISEGLAVVYQKLIWSDGKLSDPVAVPGVQYLIVEGISSYHPSIEKYYDYKIWIDTPMEIAKARGHARDGASENSHMWGLWAKNDLDYLKNHRPEQRADCIIDSSELVENH